MKQMLYVGPLGFAVFPRWNPPRGYYRWNAVRVLRIGPLVLALAL